MAIFMAAFRGCGLATVAPGPRFGSFRRPVAFAVGVRMGIIAPIGLDHC
jgi:hypothetical protein